MADTLKTAGASCPKCGYIVCSEYRAMGDTCTRWSCNECGAGGQIAGSAASAAQPTSPVKKHWSDKARKAFTAV